MNRCELEKRLANEKKILQELTEEIKRYKKEIKHFQKSIASRESWIDMNEHAKKIQLKIIKMIENDLKGGA